MDKSQLLFARAKKVLPGGVNSPVRAFTAVDGAPRFIASAQGAHITDADGRQYIDYIGSWGPMILGHNHPRVIEAVEQAVHQGLSFGAATEREVEMAELICEIVRPVEMVRMVNSGTEAVMSALRLARGYTGREKIIKFRGCYHGHSDSMLVNAGSGALTAGTPDSSGVTVGAARDTLLADYNDLDSVEALLLSNKQQVAAVIVEPVAANMGVVLPKDGFLAGLRKLCTEHGALLIFDEVITGFRLALGGAMEYFGIDADIVTYGKIIGGGMPVGAYAGKRELMEHIAPIGTVYQAGTLSGNPVAMAAGIAALSELRDNPAIYTDIADKAAVIAAALRKKPQVSVNQIGSLISAFFTDQPVTDLAAAKSSDTRAYAKYFWYMLQNGIYIAPAQFEAMFISAAHTDEDISATVEIINKYLV